MTDQNAPYPRPEASGAGRFVEQANHGSGTVTPQQGMGPYTLREWIVIGAAGVLLLLSFFSRAQGSSFIGYTPVWTLGIAWLPAVVLPLVAAALIALRRVNNMSNFGSLSIDQFASVVFIGAAITWLDTAMRLGSIASWVTWVALIVSLAGVFFTVFARFVAPFSDDFTGREEVPAHVAARPVRPLAVVPRPAASQPAPYGAPAAQAGNTAQPDGTAQPDPFAAPAANAPFGAPAADAAFSGAAPAADEASENAPYASPSTEAISTVDAQRLEAELATADDTAQELDAPAHGDDDAAVAESGVAPQPEDAGQRAQHEPVDEYADAASDEAANADKAGAASDAETAESAEPVAQPEAVSQPAPEPQAAQPFWALAPEERDVHDFEGHPIFKIGPTAWALVLEDRGTYFVIRHDDGRIGYLHNVTNITRG